MAADEILRQIERAYGSLSAPTWFTIVERKESEPFRDLIAGIGAHCEVADTTDEDDDVAYIYALTRGEEMWALALSCVAPYAVFARSNPADNVWHEILTAGSGGLDDFERRVVDAVRREGIRLLSQAELEHPVPLRLDGVPQEHVRVYQALITPGEILPWDTVTLRRLGLI
ncbi:hypothetical protein ACIA8K_27905 [Catenuloplanes sp. NPDC051500]|uniref:hypothetical protein n=1 Tax=Catenuloplanes sp. NPDC051500 TaxID=3363959 RepID=UPI0037AC2F12